MDNYMTQKEVAALMGIPPKLALEVLRQCFVPVVVFGPKTWRVREDDITDWVQECLRRRERNLGKRLDPGEVNGDGKVLKMPENHMVKYAASRKGGGLRLKVPE